MTPFCIASLGELLSVSPTEEKARENADWTVSWVGRGQSVVVDLGEYRKGLLERVEVESGLGSMAG